MTSIEQIMLKFMVKQDDVDSALSSLQDKVGRTGKAIEKTFLHAGSSARAFHRILEDMNQKVPGLGTAFQLFLDPVEAVLAGAAIAFAGFNRAIEETKRMLDRVGELNLGPFGDIKKVLSDAAREMQNIEREFRRWSEHRKDAVHDREREQQVQEEEIRQRREDEKLQMEHEHTRASIAIQRKVGSGEITSGEGAIQEEKLTEQMAREKRKKEIKNLIDEISTRNHLRADLTSLQFIAGHRAGEAKTGAEAAVTPFRTAQAKVEGLQSDIQAREAALAQMRAQFDEMAAKFHAGGLSRASLFFESPEGIAARKSTLETTEATQMKARADLEKFRDAMNKASDALDAQKDKLHDSQTQYDDATKAIQDNEEKAKELSKRLSELTVSPLGLGAVNVSHKDLEESRASLKELATGWAWQGWNNGLQTFHFFARSPFANQAQQILWLQNAARSANLAGDLDLRNQDLARIAELKKQLGGMGVLRSEDYLDSISTDIAALREQAEGSGLNVQPANGQ